MPSIVETFDNGVNLWGGNGTLATSNGFGFSLDGNPGAALRATDGGSDTFFFRANEDFRGRLGEYFDGTLSFDLRSSVDGSSTGSDVIIENSFIGLELHFALPKPAGTQWTTYEILLNENADWRVGAADGPRATASQIQSVLGNVTNLLIRSDHSSSQSETMWIDNVRLETGSRPSTEGLLYYSETSFADEGGWTVVGDVSTFQRAYDPSLGDADGYLRYVDLANGERTTTARRRSSWTSREISTAERSSSPCARTAHPASSTTTTSF